MSAATQLQSPFALFPAADGGFPETSPLQVWAPGESADYRTEEVGGEQGEPESEAEGAASRDAEAAIKRLVGAIDRKVAAQLNAILHHPDFQKLEATWRGLHYLVEQVPPGANLVIRALNVTKADLLKDLEKAAEFDQSVLFKKVYEEEYGQLGGRPYGLLVGDYDFGRTGSDVRLLQMIAGVAAAAHAPFVAAAAPGLFGLEHFAELARPLDLARLFEGEEYVAWRSFRDAEDSRYVALTLPRVLARLPHGEQTVRHEPAFAFEEEVEGATADRYLWMSAAWAYAGRGVAAFAASGWLAQVRGVAGGRVEGLPVHAFPTEEGTAVKGPAEVALTDRREFELAGLGFLPLVQGKHGGGVAFPGARSCQKPRTYADPAASANAELSAQLNLLLCASRFAHYLKVMARDKLGSFMDAADCTAWLNRWLNGYCVNPVGATEETKAKRPLTEARVEVRPVRSKPGWYEAVAHLRPHFQLDGLSTSLRLVAEVPRKG
jgi:type VI secretion system protein ImpC